MRKQVRIAAIAALLALGGFSASAQVTDAADATLTKGTDKAKFVKLIDNKGTIKYLRSSNGISQITSTSAGNKTTTTWQLGGELTTDTEIKLGTNKFTIDGENFIVKGITEIATQATTPGATPGAVTTNWKVLVKDEVTGQVHTKSLADLLKVQGVHEKDAVDAGEEGVNSIVVDCAGITSTTEEYKVSVYRNGAKLVSGEDYTFATADKVTVSGNADWSLYTGDVIEVHYIK